MDSSDYQNTNEDLLHTKRYAMYWLSSLLSNIGTWMQQVAQPWLILSLFHSSFWVGLDSFLLNAPAWIFTLWGGALADRFDRKKIVILCQSFQFFCVLILLAFILIGKVKIWMILICSLLIGISDSLSMPAFQSIIPSLVKKEDVAQAVALNSIQFNLSRILGPVLAGIVIASYGAAVCYETNLLSYAPFFLSLYFIYPRGVFKKNHTLTTDSKVSAFYQFKSILKERTYQFPLLTVLTTSLFCGPLLIFCPVIVRDFFQGGAHELGWAMTAFGVGGVLGGIISSFWGWGKKITKIKTISNLIASFLGCILILVAFSPTLLFLDAFLLFAGALLTMTNVISNSNLQQSASENTRGKIVSLFQMALHSGLSIGALVTGGMSAIFGIKPTLIMNGIFAIIFQLSILYFRKWDRKDRELVKTQLP